MAGTKFDGSVVASGGNNLICRAVRLSTHSGVRAAMKYSSTSCSVHAVEQIPAKASKKSTEHNIAVDISHQAMMQCLSSTYGAYVAAAASCH
jgi:hypothetical protein